MLGGQLSLIHNRIIDYPGLQAENGEEMRRYFVRHAESLQCRYRVNTRVVKIDAERKVAVVETGGLKTQIGFRYLIYAAGAVRRKLGVPGEKEMFARGEIYSATKDSHLFKGKSAAVIGGGDRAFEGACLLAEAGAHVYLIHRSERFRARQAYLSRAQSYKNIRILPNMRVKAIIGKTKPKRWNSSIQAVNPVFCRYPRFSSGLGWNQTAHSFKMLRGQMRTGTLFRTVTGKPNVNGCMQSETTALVRFIPVLQGRPGRGLLQQSILPPVWRRYPRGKINDLLPALRPRARRHKAG